MAGPPDSLTSALSDRYRIESEIGSGGMATVYLATDIRHERKVALKVLRSDLAASLGAERFLQEVRVTANLQHPHILPLFDSGEAEGYLFYVMPYIDGESLRERLVRERELPVPEAARLLRDVVDALAAAHKLGVVHRDIKPENILISGRHAMVADFGVAKAVSEATGRHKLTTLGVALGTPSYMAPEQAAADETIDHRADIYAVGAMAYELLTGQPPFTGGSPQQVLAAQVMEAPKSVTELRASVPPALETLIMRCLEKKPADRWQSAEELLPHLEAAATPSGGLTPTDLHPVSKGESIPRRPRLKWIGGVGTTLAVVFLGFWALTQRSNRSSGGAGSAATTDSLLVAVLPFENRTGDPAYDPLAAMIAGETTRKLDQVMSLTTVSSAAIQDILGEGETTTTISNLALARRTGARFAIAGSLAKIADQLRFEAELLDVVGERRIRALEPMAGPADSAETVVENVAEGYAAGTSALLVPQSGWSWTGMSLPPNLEAYQAFTSGAEAFCESQYGDAATSFARASSLAPAWPVPLLQLIPALQNDNRWGETPSIWDKVRPLLPALTTQERYLWEWLTGRTDYQQYRAAEGLFEQDSAFYGYPLAFVAQHLNLMDRARAGVLAIDFNAVCPWVPFWLLASQTLHLVGEDEAALARAEDGRRRFPDSRSLIIVEARALAGLGEVERVLSLSDTLKNLPRDANGIFRALREMGLELRVHGHGEAASAILEDALAWAEASSGVEDLERARVFHYLGRDQEAVLILEQLPWREDAGRYLALSLDGLGRRAEADSVMAEVAAANRRDRGPALLAARRGEVRKAVELFRDVFDSNASFYHNGAVLMHLHPDLKPIRDDPIFQNFLRPEG